MLKYVVVLALLVASVSATSYSTVLAKYNVSSSVSSILVPVQLQLNGSNYTLLYFHNSPYLLANDTNGTLVFNSSIAYAVAGNYLTNNALNSPVLQDAYVQMQNYEASSASAINQCAQITGLAGTTGSNTCTTANYCNSCSTIPACKMVLLKTGGPADAFGLGIQQFEGQYANLTSNYAKFYSAINYINTSNAKSNMADMNSAFSEISTITKDIYENPIFPPTKNITPTMYQSNCGLPANLGSSINTSLKNAPWFCNAVGYCPYTTYNYSALNSINSLLTQISSLPISSTAVMSIATNISANDYSYYRPILYRQKSVIYAHMLNTTLFGYGKLVNNSVNISSHISNATFINTLTALQRSYANLSSNYINLNLTTYNSTMAAQIKNLSSQYSTINATYSSIENLSKSNTQRILEYQLDSSSQSSQLSALAFSEYAINSQVSSKINNTKATYASLQSINQSLQSMSPSAPILAEISRFVDSGAVTAIEAGMSAPYVAKVSAAPAYAALISLIIDLALLTVLFVFYMRLNKKHHIHTKPGAKKNWRIIFIAAILLIALDVGATYYSALQATSFTPASAFVSSVHNAKTVYLISNGTSTGITNCSKSISKALTLQNKSVSSITISSTGLCTVNGFVGNESSCIDHAAVNSNPVIVLSNGNSPTVKSYSFYGSALFVSGSNEFLNACIPAQLIS